MKDRITFLDMNEEELRDLVRRERKAKLKWKKRYEDLKREPADECSLEGNKGGSYVTLRQVYHEPKYDQPVEGMAYLEVGESCVVTVRQEISVAALAIVLTWVGDEGFQKIIDQYLARGGGSPVIKVEHDVRKEDQEQA